MPVKPILMSDLWRTAPPASPALSHRQAIGSGSYNRFNLLAPRGRTASVGKRLRSSDEEQAAVKQPRLDPNKVFEQLAKHDTHLDTAKDRIKTAKDFIDNTYSGDNVTGIILLGLLNALGDLVMHGEAMKSTLVDFCKASTTPQVTPPTPGPSSQGGYPFESGHGPIFSFGKSAGNNRRPSVARPPAKPAPSAEDVLKHKVKKVLREAERRVVVFDLDLGQAPTINKETISRKVTMALHQKSDKGEHDWNIKDAGEMVDDVLSCSQLEFLGSSTQKFFNRRKADDPRNGKMCTVPVRMDFKNKDTRIRAETTLRGICKVNCSVPYPRKLRTMIYDLVQLGKAKYPKNYIRTKIDIDNMKLSAQVRLQNGWEGVGPVIPIPLDILDRNTVIPPDDPTDEDDMIVSETPILEKVVGSNPVVASQPAAGSQSAGASTPVS